MQFESSVRVRQRPSGSANAIEGKVLIRRVGTPTAVRATLVIAAGARIIRIIHICEKDQFFCLL